MRLGFPRIRPESGERIRWVHWALAIVLMVGNALLLTVLAEDAPSALFVGVDSALRSARRAEAERHAPELLVLAEDLRGAARQEYASERARFLWFRDYAGVRSCLSASKAIAVAAAGFASRDKGKDLQSLAARMNEVGEQVEDAVRKINGYPVRESTRRALSRSELYYHRAVEAHRGDDLVRASALLVEADRALSDAQRGFQRELDAASVYAPLWARWARSGIQTSRSTGGTVILVDKMRRRCHLYRGGRRVASYAADLGPNWLGDKQWSGDKKTPEGIYRITDMKSGRRTKYHKALLINYPNDEDRRQFEAAKRSGNVPRSARIGGLIEIHGDGGRGYDWTLGCVALTNRDMDRLYAQVSVGTPVIIVGELPSDFSHAN
jgi:hypothetical protein